MNARPLLLLAALVLPGLAAAEDLVFIQQGTLPIVLSAPHGGTREVGQVAVRTNTLARHFVTARDAGTAELAERTAAELEQHLGGKPFLVIARFGRKYIDANRAAKDAFEDEAARATYEAYHRALSNACAAVRQRWGHGVLLDIHGQSANADAIYRGTGNGLTVSALTNRLGSALLTGPQSLFGECAARGHLVIPAVSATNRETRSYGGGFIVQTFGSHRPGGLDALQMEFGSSFRGKKSRDAFAADLAAAIASFCRTAQLLPDAAATEK